MEAQYETMLQQLPRSALATEMVHKGLCSLTELQTLHSFQVEDSMCVMLNSLVQNGRLTKSKTKVPDVEGTRAFCSNISIAKIW